MRGVDKDWLVRIAASYAPEVEVKEPAEVREAIIKLLSAPLGVTDEAALEGGE